MKFTKAQLEKAFIETIKYIEPLSDYRLFIISANGIIKACSMKEK